MNPEQGELKRGEASLIIFFPLSYQGRGIKGVGYPINIEGVRFIEKLETPEFPILSGSPPVPLPYQKAYIPGKELEREAVGAFREGF